MRIPNVGAACTRIIWCAIAILTSPAIAAAQDQVDSTQVANETATAGSVDFGADNLWGVIVDTGAFGIVIFAVFLLGIFLVSFKLFELYSDRRKARTLMKAEVQSMNTHEMVSLVEGESRHMLSEILATMLNVFRTQKSAESLHDEISNYLQLKQGQFASYRERVDFLSDSAGALGLLGTVWGMFQVFYNPTLDKQTILAGMGFALITTLLGLVVSLILNLSVTELFSVFSRRLDKVGATADLFRFRLMELAGDVQPVTSRPNSPVIGQPRVRDASIPPASPQTQTSAPTGLENRQTDTEPRPISRTSTSEGTAAPDSKGPVTTEVSPARIRFERQFGPQVAGSELDEVAFLVESDSGEAVSGKDVVVELRADDGFLSGGRKKIKLTTDDNGKASFSWSVGEKAGTKHARATINETQTSVSLAVEVVPGKPSNVELGGKNQTSLRGNELDEPLAVVVTDSYGNRISGQRVRFKIELGDGQFEDGSTSVVHTTDQSGKASTRFTLDQQGAFNIVSATIEGIDTEFKFQAMGTEN